MKSAKPALNGADAVDAFMAGLKHPLKAEIQAIRRTILGVSSKIQEEIKWNAPGFRTTESFATVNLRSVDRLQFIFHLGAKIRSDMKEMQIADPSGLLKWVAKDRCLVTVGAAKDIPASTAAFQAIVRQWIKHV